MTELSDGRPTFSPDTSRALGGVLSVTMIACSTLAALTHSADIYPTIGVFLLSVLFVTVIAVPREK